MVANTPECPDILPARKPSRRSLREQSKLPGKLRLRAPEGHEIGPRALEKTRRKRPRQPLQRGMGSGMSKKGSR
jgi:hypothetical protein